MGNATRARPCSYSAALTCCVCVCVCATAPASHCIITFARRVLACSLNFNDVDVAEDNFVFCCLENKQKGPPARSSSLTCSLRKMSAGQISVFLIYNERNLLGWEFSTCLEMIFFSKKKCTVEHYFTKQVSQTWLMSRNYPTSSSCIGIHSETLLIICYVIY